MYKILMLAKREFLTSVRTKSFIIGLIIAPLFMGGSLIAFGLLKDKVDINDKKIVVLDHSGLIADKLVEMAKYRNDHEIYNEDSTKQVKPKYILKIVEPDTSNLFKQKLELSNQVRNKEIHSFIEIGPNILNPGNNPEKARIKYYSENSIMDEVREWITWPVNNYIRQLRVAHLNLGQEETKDLFYYHNIEALGLVKMEEGTGNMQEAKQSNMAEAILIPYILLILMFMMVMMTAIPLLSSVMEEKTERIAEVLLGSATPFQFMFGKILGSVSVSLTGSAIYIAGGILVAVNLGYTDLIPFNLIPWYFIFMLLNVIMVGSIMAGLGAACNDQKDAQSLQFPAMLPVLLPLFVIMPILKDPLSGFSTGMSLFPPFTPMLMITRLATPVTIPVWQPIVGLIGVILFTILSVYVGSRILRGLILTSGQKPKLSTLIKYAIRR